MSNDTKVQTKRYAKLRLPELQAKYEEVVGERSRSPNRKFLLRRIDEALRSEGARTEVAAASEATSAPAEAEETARTGERGASQKMRVLPLTLPPAAVDGMDGVWRKRGIPSRMEFLRRAIAAYLKELGAPAEAALFKHSA